MLCESFTTTGRSPWVALLVAEAFAVEGILLSAPLSSSGVPPSQTSPAPSPNESQVWDFAELRLRIARTGLLVIAEGAVSLAPRRAWLCSDPGLVAS